MPRCTTHPSKEMVRVLQGFETIGVGWDRHQAYFEDYICPDCQFRLRLHYRVMDIGRTKTFSSFRPPADGQTTLQ